MASTYSEMWLKLAYGAYETLEKVPSAETGTREALWDMAAEALKKAVGEYKWSDFISVCLLGVKAGCDFEAFKGALAILGWLPEAEEVE